MYPAKVRDDQVRDVIHDLTIEGRPPSGVAVRTALAERFGCRGGVSRVYRLLKAAAPAIDSGSSASIAGRLLEQENQTLREQLRQHRQQQNAHQAYWMRQVSGLRERVSTVVSLVSRAAAAGEFTETLQAEVQAAEIEAGRLEVLLRAFGPGVERIKLEE